MTIYSKPLGTASASATGLYPMYTVPASGGPAVLRSFTLALPAGAAAHLSCTIGGVEVNLTLIDNTSGSAGVAQSVTVYQPLEPNDTIQLHIDTAPPLYQVTAVAGGYQFSSP